jgi:hypothetical protein
MIYIIDECVVSFYGIMLIRIYDSDSIDRRVAL